MRDIRRKGRMQCRIRPFCSICLRAFRPTRQAAALSRKYAPATPPLNFSFQIPHIAACGVLKYPQAEFRDNRQHMVEHIGLYFFVNRPLGHFRKEIEFDGQPLSKGTSRDSRRQCNRSKNLIPHLGLLDQTESFHQEYERALPRL